MKNLIIENKTNAPYISFDAVNHLLEIKGESYPENAKAFFEPVVLWIEKYLETIKDEAVTVNIELKYFNSSTAKILMNIFDLLDWAAMSGKNITINWIYDKRNDNAVEYGEDFQEDLGSVDFNLKPKDYESK